MSARVSRVRRGESFGRQVTPAMASTLVLLISTSRRSMSATPSVTLGEKVYVRTPPITAKSRVSHAAPPVSKIRLSSSTRPFAVRRPGRITSYSVSVPRRTNPRSANAPQRPLRTSASKVKVADRFFTAVPKSMKIGTLRGPTVIAPSSSDAHR
jgi:hypothetical protein